MGSRTTWFQYIVSLTISLMLVPDMTPTAGTNIGKENWSFGQHTNMDKKGGVLILIM